MVVKPISGSEVARRGANLSSFSCATFAVFRGFDARTGHAEIIRFAGAMRHAYRAPRGPFLVPQANPSVCKPSSDILKPHARRALLPWATDARPSTRKVGGRGRQIGRATCRERGCQYV